jgi:alcohol dehydrogenase class IV
VCAAILPHGVKANIRALRSRAPESDALLRYEEIARIVTGNSKATVDDGANWIGELVQSLGVPPLRTYGITAGDASAVVQKAERASSMKANPISLTEEELTGVFAESL